MKTKKMSMFLTMVLAASLFVAGCGNSDKGKEATKNSTVETTSSESVAKTDVRVSMVKGFSSISMVNLMQENEDEKVANQYNFEVATAPDEVSAKIISGETDIAAIPTNMAAVLYNKTEGKLQILAVNTLGVIKLVSSDPAIQSLQDIKGKTVYASGQGAIPEYTFDYILKANNIQPQTDVTIEYKPGHEEVAGLLTSNQADLATIPEPTLSQVMTQRTDLHVVADLTEEWEKLNTGTILSQGCVVVSKDFLDKNPDAVKAFMKEYEASAKKVNEDVATTAKLCGKYEIIPEKVAVTAIPECHQVFIAGKELQKGLTPFYQVLFDANPKSVGGAVPDANFYYGGE